MPILAFNAAGRAVWYSGVIFLGWVGMRIPSQKSTLACESLASDWLIFHAAGF